MDPTPRTDIRAIDITCATLTSQRSLKEEIQTKNVHI